MTETQDIHRRFEPTLSYAKEFNTVRDLQKGHARFLWFQLLTVMIENMTDDRAAIEDMLKYARTQYADNTVILEKITKFGSDLIDSQTQFGAIEWYTGDNFVSQLVNGALKKEDYMVLYKLRAFIKRLIEAIKNESKITKEYWDENLILYSGRSLTEGDVDVLRGQEGEIIAINGFLSTSLTVRAARCYHRDMYFRITTPVDLQTVHFAAVRHRSEIKEDDEVLFSLSSTFRVGKTTDGHLDKDTAGLIVDLIATDDGSDIFNTYYSWTQQHYNMSHAIIFGHLLIQMGEYTAALIYFDEYCQTEDRFRLLINKGCAHFRREGTGDLGIAELYFLDALTIVTNNPERTDDRVRVLTNLGALYDRLEKYDEALEKFKEAKELAPNDSLMLATLNNNIGVVYDQGLEKYDEAEAYYEMALEYYRPHSSHHAYAQTIQNLACVLDTRGQHARARNLYCDAKNIYARTLPLTHPDMKRVLVNIAMTHQCEGQFNESININLQAEDLSESDSLVEASRLCNLGETYREKGLYVLAMEHSKRGLYMRQRILVQTPEHVDIATALRNIGQIYLARGDLTEAAREFDKAETMLKHALDTRRIENSPTLAVVYDCLGQLLLERGKADEALQQARSARTIFEHEQLTTVFDYVTCLLTIAKAHHQLAEYHQAQNIASLTLAIFDNHLRVHPARIQALYCLASAAEALHDFPAARHNIEDALKYLKDIGSDEIRLFYKCTSKCAAICFRQGDYASAYNYLTLWYRRVPYERNELH